jgi:hypothetical protein
MILQQKSLKEFTLINGNMQPIYVSLYKYIDGEWVQGEYSNTTYNEEGMLILEPNVETTIIFEGDGIYKISGDAHYIVHNITDLLDIRQQFLTNALMEYKVDRCDHGSYYDYVTFCIVFDSYIALVETTFKTGYAVDSIIPKTVIYKINYLYNQLLKYKP